MMHSPAPNKNYKSQRSLASATTFGICIVQTLVGLQYQHNSHNYSHHQQNTHDNPPHYKHDKNLPHSSSCPPHSNNVHHGWMKSDQCMFDRLHYYHSHKRSIQQQSSSHRCPQHLASARTPSTDNPHHHLSMSSNHQGSLSICLNPFRCKSHKHLLCRCVLFD